MLESIAKTTKQEIPVNWRAKGPPFFHYAYFAEGVYEGDADGEQPNAYDRLFGVLGFEDVPDSFKRPMYTVSDHDVKARTECLKSIGSKPTYLLVQLLASTKYRSLPMFPIERTMEAASEVAARRRLSILVAHHEPFPPPIVAIIKKTKAIDISRLTSVTAFVAMMAGAKAVVAPDSAALHFAAAFDTPALGLWGSHDPDCRTKYYPRQVHLHHPEAPCYNVLGNAAPHELPAQKCSEGASQKWCACFSSITAEEVADALEELLRDY
jgi:ADP-heptose:LPS heptosyltransferase